LPEHTKEIQGKNWKIKFFSQIFEPRAPKIQSRNANHSHETLRLFLFLLLILLPTNPFRNPYFEISKYVKSVLQSDETVLRPTLFPIHWVAPVIFAWLKKRKPPNLHWVKLRLYSFHYNINLKHIEILYTLQVFNFCVRVYNNSKHWKLNTDCSLI
jgi:hypothetical protein